MPYQKQVLPIRYGSKNLLETYLKDILHSSDFIIESFFCEQWTVKVPQLLTTAQVEDLATKIRTHYH
ncbi:hypothetical protein F5Y18DRAFT_388941 [Xylariaceae sp. FL1019]|nr:hypothetical protein F5Y18DRAFT_388941 [Xylariaceae sp. FL1019]